MMDFEKILDMLIHKYGHESEEVLAWCKFQQELENLCEKMGEYAAEKLMA